MSERDGALSKVRITPDGSVVMILGNDATGYDDGGRIVIKPNGTGHIEMCVYKISANGNRRATNLTYTLTPKDVSRVREGMNYVNVTAFKDTHTKGGE